MWRPNGCDPQESVEMLIFGHSKPQANLQIHYLDSRELRIGRDVG
jgi:hypothetical protein